MRSISIGLALLLPVSALGAPSQLTASSDCAPLCLADAIDQISPDGIIYLEPGDYSEALYLSKNVQLIGLGTPESVTLGQQSPDEPFAIIGSKQLTLTNLSLLIPDQKYLFSVVGALTLDGVHLIPAVDGPVSSQTTPSSQTPFYLAPNSALHITNSLINGLGPLSIPDGALISSDSATLSVDNVLFSDNQRRLIIAENSIVDITRSHLSSSHGSLLVAAGGVIHVDQVSFSEVSTNDEGLIQVQNSQLNINNSVFSSLSSQTSGRHIYAVNSLLSVNRSTFEGAKSPGGSAILYSDEQLGYRWPGQDAVRISNSTFKFNWADHPDSPGGGAVLIGVSDERPIVIETSHFEKNGTSERGGAVLVVGAESVIRENTFFYNSASEGGGVSIVEGFGAVNDNLYCENEATQIGPSSSSNGGGLSVVNETQAQRTLLDGNAFVRNRSKENGGGASLIGHDFNLQHNVFALNSAQSTLSGTFGSQFLSSELFVADLRPLDWNNLNYTGFPIGGNLFDWVGETDDTAVLILSDRFFSTSNANWNLTKNVWTHGSSPSISISTIDPSYQPVIMNQVPSPSTEIYITPRYAAFTLNTPCDQLDPRATDADGYSIGLVDNAPLFLDSDHDGVTKATDCDDRLNDGVTSAPGLVEICDGVDNDCDGRVDDLDSDVDGRPVFQDSDGDGFGAGAALFNVLRCQPQIGESFTDGDCDDTLRLTFPGSEQVETSALDVDSNCDGLIGVDFDDDGFISDEFGGDDCDDLDQAIFPNAPDTVGDTVDNNCDGIDGVDDDTDGFASLDSGGDDCNDLNINIFPSAADTVGDDLDNNCDGIDGVDDDGDGFASDGSRGNDCDDTDPFINPGAIDLVDGLGDSNCDGADGDCDDSEPLVYPSAPDQWYDGVNSNCDEADDYDQDGDGSRSADEGADEGGDDCDDTDPNIFPGAADQWYDGVDSNCDGADDYDQDNDGHRAELVGGDDCDDTDPTINPSVVNDPTNGVDNDCNGSYQLPENLQSGGCESASLGFSPLWALSLLGLLFRRRQDR